MRWNCEPFGYDACGQRHPNEDAVCCRPTPPWTFATGRNSGDGSLDLHRPGPRRVAGAQPAPTRPAPAPPAGMRRPMPKPVPDDPAVVTDEQIDTAIHRGVNYLLSIYAGDDPPAPVDLPAYDRGLGFWGLDVSYEGGPYSLAVYALLESGLAIKDPRLDLRHAEMKAMLDRMKSYNPSGYYETYTRGIRRYRTCRLRPARGPRRPDGRRVLARQRLRRRRVYLLGQNAEGRDSKAGRSTFKRTIARRPGHRGSRQDKIARSEPGSRRTNRLFGSKA